MLNRFEVIWQKIMRYKYIENFEHSETKRDQVMTIFTAMAGKQNHPYHTCITSLRT